MRSLRYGPGDELHERCLELIRGRTDLAPVAAVITGSGLGDAMAGIEPEAEFSYSELPGFPTPTVPGHAGRLVLGSFGGVPVAAFLGRIHYYEGHPLSLVTLPARLATTLGAGTLVITAAAGGLHPALEPGTLVVGTDHINFLGENPLRGWRDEAGTPAFVSVRDVYPERLAELALAAAEETGLPAARGVYVAFPGPTYETPAEIEFIRKIGADVVGMSVVPEALAATANGVPCLGLFCVTNRVGAPVSHIEVEEVASAFAARLGDVLRIVLPKL